MACELLTYKPASLLLTRAYRRKYYETVFPFLNDTYEFLTHFGSGYKLTIRNMSVCQVNICDDSTATLFKNERLMYSPCTLSVSFHSERALQGHCVTNATFRIGTSL